MKQTHRAIIITWWKTFPQWVLGSQIVDQSGNGSHWEKTEPRTFSFLFCQFHPSLWCSVMQSADGSSSVILLVKRPGFGNIIFTYGRDTKSGCSDDRFIFSRICKSGAVISRKTRHGRDGFRVNMGYGRSFGGAKGLNTTSWRSYSRPKFLKCCFFFFSRFYA